MYSHYDHNLILENIVKYTRALYVYMFSQRDYNLFLVKSNFIYCLYNYKILHIQCGNIRNINFENLDKSTHLYLILKVL